MNFIEKLGLLAFIWAMAGITNESSVIRNTALIFSLIGAIVFIFSGLGGKNDIN